MTEEEKIVIAHLVGAWNSFRQLPVQHPSDTSEFLQHMHELQRIIMTREAVRNNPDLFYNEQKMTNGSPARPVFYRKRS